MREKVRPKMGKIDIDYQKLHDAFFRWQTKPRMCIHGDLYYEVCNFHFLNFNLKSYLTYLTKKGKEMETKLKEKKPGNLTDDLRIALGMPTGANAEKIPPPWLIAMQRYGPPPSYPSLKIPGLNAPIPDVTISLLYEFLISFLDFVILLLRVVHLAIMQAVGENHL